MEPPEVFVWAAFRWLLPWRVWLICMEENLYLWPLEMKIIHKHIALSRKRREKDKGKKEQLIAEEEEGGGTSEVCRRCLWLKRMAWARKLWWGSWTSPKWGLFSLWATLRLMHAFITRRLGCFDAHLSALRKNTINLLQLIQNSAAWVLIKTKRELTLGLF